MDSISYITKQHCRSGISVLCVIILTVMAVIGCLYTLDSQNVIGGIFTCLTSLQALSGWLLLICPQFGCLLMQFPTGLWAAICFTSSLFLLPTGYLFLTRSDMQSYSNQLLSVYGYHLATQSSVTGAIFLIGGLIAFLLSCLLFFLGRYLRTVRKCLHDDIRRGGTVQLEALSFLVFTVIIVGTVIFLILSGESLSGILADKFNLFMLIETAAAGLFFFCTGLLARDFRSKTFAFKVFEDQMMKVETNADGTVYVPINEDSNEDETPTHPTVPMTQPTASGKPVKSGKKDYIKEISLVMTAEGDKALSENTEPFIL